MRILIAIVILICLFEKEATASSLSTPESDGASKSSRSKVIQKDPTGDSAQSNTRALSSAINELSTTIRENYTAKPNEYENEKRQIERDSLKAEEKIADETESLAIYTDRLASFTRILVGVGVIQIGVFVWQLILMTKATSAAKKSADAAKTSAEAVMLSERAYVKMSHMEPGVMFIDDITVITAKVLVKLENCGRTPASITDVHLRISRIAFADQLPETPDYGDSIPIGCPFLVPGDFVNVPTVRGVGDDQRRRIVVFGYVDYIDVFGVRHRAGYAREHVENIQGNNLVFVSAPGYNYDRPRKKSEGNDWDQPVA